MLLLNIINDILDFSKIESGQMSVSPAPCDLENIIDSVYKALEVKTHGSGVDLMSDIADDVPKHFTSDPVRIQQILFNLIGNAIKFT